MPKSFNYNGFDDTSIAAYDGFKTVNYSDDAIVAIDVFDGALESALDRLTSIGALPTRQFVMRTWLAK